MKRHVKTLNEYMHSGDDEMLRNLSWVGIPNINIKRSGDRPIFEIRTPVVMKWHLYILMSPSPGVIRHKTDAERITDLKSLMNCEVLVWNFRQSTLIKPLRADRRIRWCCSWRFHADNNLTHFVTSIKYGLSCRIWQHSAGKDHFPCGYLSWKVHSLRTFCLITAIDDISPVEPQGCVPLPVKLIGSCEIWTEF